MKTVKLTKIDKWTFEFSDGVDRRDIKHIVQVLQRQFNTYKRRTRLERLKGERKAVTQPTLLNGNLKEPTNA